MYLSPFLASPFLASTSTYRSDFVGGWDGLVGYWYLDDPFASSKDTSRIVEEGVNAYVRATYGFAGSYTGGLIDQDYGFGGGFSIPFLGRTPGRKGIRDFLIREGYGDINSDPGYTSGANGGRVAVVAMSTIGAIYAVRGYELTFGNNFRLSPFGNRTGNQWGRYPHYHRRFPTPNTPGGGIARHRPWQPAPPGYPWWWRF